MLRLKHSLVLIAMLSAGCTVGPDFKVPEAPGGRTFLPASGRAGADQVPGRTVARGAQIPPEWWNLFEAPGLTRLVMDGITHNADLKAAEAAVRVAGANARAQRGALFPLVTAGLDASRQKIAATVGADGGDSPSPAIYNVVTRQVSVSFVPDVWGGTRRQIESADAQAEAEAFRREGVYLTLASNIALAAIEEARLRGQIAATNRIVDLQLDLLRVLQRQRDQGQIALPDVVTQESAVAQTRLLLAPLERQLAQQRNLLAFLTGRMPSESSAMATFRLNAFRLPRRLPLSVPGDLVRQRPDVRTSEASLRAANAQIGAAIANRLPQITLTGNAGKTWSSVPDLSPSGAFWAVAGNLAQTVFDAGTLEQRQRASEEATAQASAEYRSVVLASLQNVADVLSALQSDARAFTAAITAERLAEQNINLVRRQVEQGQLNIALLIAAQETYLQASLGRVDAEAARLADSVALFQALGGGWWNRTHVRPGQSDRPVGL